jgi:hypothetical protein
VPPAPQPDIFTWTCAGLVAAPAVVALVAGAALILTADKALGGPAGLGAVCGLFGSLPLLVAEYYAVVRRSRRATSLIAYLTVWFAIMGSIAWLAGLLDVLRLKSPGPDSMSPGMFAIYSAFLACLVMVGLGHLRWLRLLKAAPKGILSQDE